MAKKKSITAIIIMMPMKNSNLYLVQEHPGRSSGRIPMAPGLCAPAWEVPAAEHWGAPQGPMMAKKNKVQAEAARVAMLMKNSNLCLAQEQLSWSSGGAPMAPGLCAPALEALAGACWGAPQAPAMAKKK